MPSRAPVESGSPSPRDKDRERQPENRQRELDIEPPSPQLLKWEGCRAPPPSSRRAASARHHQRLARARPRSSRLTRETNPSASGFDRLAPNSPHSSGPAPPDRNRWPRRRPRAHEETRSQGVTRPYPRPADSIGSCRGRPNSCAPARSRPRAHEETTIKQLTRLRLGLVPGILSPRGRPRSST